MEQYIPKDKEIIELKDWLSLHLNLLQKDKIAALMHCYYRKRKGTIILCDINSIPEGYTVEDVVDIINGKHIDL